MDLSTLKGTDNSQFTNDTTFNAIHPVTGEDSLVITIKSAKNPSVRGRLAKLLTRMSEESEKLKKPTLTDDQANAISNKVDGYSKDIAHLVFVSFDGLTDGGKPVKCTDELKAQLVDNYDWLRDQIVEQAASSQAFFTS